MSEAEADQLDPDEIGLKLTARQEKAARLHVLEGLSHSDAYRGAYTAENMSPQHVWTEASRLFALPKVARYVQALRGALRRSSEQTLETITEELDEMRNLAAGLGQAAAGVAAITAKAKLHGIEPPQRSSVTLTDDRAGKPDFQGMLDKAVQQAALAQEQAKDTSTGEAEAEASTGDHAAPANATSSVNAPKLH